MPVDYISKNDLNLENINNNQLPRFIRTVNFLNQYQLLTKPYKDDKNIAQIASLSEKNKEWAYRLIHDLVMTQKLTQSSFDEAMRLINIKLIKPAISTAEKNSRKQTGKAHSNICINSSLNFFMEHDNSHEYPEGGVGKVKKGFSSITSPHPEHAIKIYHSDDNTIEENVIEAKREAKYHHLLGNHPVHFFKRKDKVALIYPWQKGVPLSELTSNDEGNQFLKSDLKLRLACFQSLLNDIDKIHANFRVYNDIRPDNFIINIHANPPTMRLIDFGFCHKPYIPSRTPIYEGQHSATMHECEVDGTGGTGQPYTFPNDMATFACYGADLFPDIMEAGLAPLQSQYNWYPFKSVVSPNKMSVHQKAIYTLFEALLHGGHAYAKELRPTSKESLAYCEKIIENWDILDEHMLDKIVCTTIKNPDLSVDAILHGHVKRLK